MSITRCSVDTNVIGVLPEAPTLPANQLQKKFDESATNIKEYINDIMLQEIEQLINKEKTTLQTNINNTKTELLNNISEKILEDNKKKYYIGKIIIDTENVNPAIYLGFGTWEPWGSGRVPVGVDEAQEEFNSVEKIGGEKKHTLTVGEMPNVDVTAKLTNNKIRMTTGVYDISGMASGQYNMVVNSDSGSEYDDLIVNGGSQPHNNIQPYITCYMWKRVS